MLIVVLKPTKPVFCIDNMYYPPAGTFYPVFTKFNDATSAVVVKFSHNRVSLEKLQLPIDTSAENTSLTSSSRLTNL